MAKEKKEKILEQTISTFRAVGIVTGVDRDNFYNTGIVIIRKTGQACHH